jgi:hypothetical protein
MGQHVFNMWKVLGLIPKTKENEKEKITTK